MKDSQTRRYLKETATTQVSNIIRAMYSVTFNGTVNEKQLVD